MKKSIFLTLFLFSIAYSSCDKSSTVEFEISHQTDVQYVSGLPLGIPFTIVSGMELTNPNQKFEAEGTVPQFILSGNTTQFQMSIESPTNADFNSIRSIKIFIDADGEESERRLLAQKENIPENHSKSLELDILDLDLAAYMKQDEFEISTETILRKEVSNDFKIRCNYTFRLQGETF